jgi:hypothetical protein
MAYTTSQIDAIIATLEAGLGQGYAEIMYENRRITYRSVADVRNAIAYFRGLYGSASDAVAPAQPRTRTFFLFGGDRGF